jgi:hypothetical protein
VFGSLAVPAFAALASALPGVPVCDHVGGPGTRLNTPQKLVGAMKAGEVGCVQGRMRGNASIRRDQVWLMGRPGGNGRIVGRLQVERGATRVTISDLALDVPRRRSVVPAVVILGDRTRLLRNDITSSGVSICVLLGSSGHHGDVRADGVLIEHNRIHDCGTPNNHKHGIYLEHTMNTRIAANAIVDNADRGIQLYPYARRTLITGNVIDGNGEGITFGGFGSRTSSGNRVVGNVIANSRIRAAVESSYPAGTAPGTGNVVERNCVSGRAPVIDLAGGGFLARENTEAVGGACVELLASGRRLARTAAPIELADVYGAASRELDAAARP